MMMQQAATQGLLRSPIRANFQNIPRKLKNIEFYEEHKSKVYG